MAKAKQDLERGAQDPRRVVAYDHVARVAYMTLQPGGATPAEIIQNSEEAGTPLSVYTIQRIVSALERAGFTVIGRGGSQGATSIPLSLAAPHGLPRVADYTVTFPAGDVLAAHAQLTQARNVTVLTTGHMSATYRVAGLPADHEVFLGRVAALGASREFVPRES